MSTNAVTPNQDAVQTDIFIAAPMERVFHAITDPRQLIQWWGQADRYRITECHMDLRPGGKWRTAGVGADGKPFHVEGEYRKIDPPRRLVYSWRPSYRVLPETLVRWELHPEGQGTRVHVEHSGFSGDLATAQEHGTGWVRILGWVQAYVERNETIDTRPAAAPSQP